MNGILNSPNIHRRRLLQTLAVAGVGIVGGIGQVSAQENRLRWIFETNNSVVSSPTIFNGQIFFGTYNGIVYAVEQATGDEIWNFQTNGSVRSSPTVVDDRVFVGSSDNNVYALNVVSGDEEWVFETGETRDVGGVKSSPSVNNGTVFFGSRFVRDRDAGIFAVDAATGGRQWTVQTGGSVLSSPIIANGTLYVGCNDNYVYAVDATSGDRKWVYETNGSVESSPTIYNNNIIVGSQDGNLYAVNAESGEENWRFESSDAINSSPTVLDETVYFQNRKNLFSLNAMSGEENWRTSAGGQSSPTIMNETIFVGINDGALLQVDANTGEREWTFGGEQKILSSPTVVDGTLFFGSHDDGLTAIDITGTDASSQGSRMRFGTLGHHDQVEYVNQAIPNSDTGENSEQVTEEQTESPEGGTSDPEENPEQTTSGGDSGLIGPIVAGGGGIGVAAIGAYTLLRKRKNDSSGGTDVSQSQASETPSTGKEPSTSVSSGEQLTSPEETFHLPEQAVPNTVPSPTRVSISYNEMNKEEPLGSGGNADVYKVTASTESGQVQLAVKEPRMSGTIDTETIEQLVDEAKTWQQLDDHDHIVSVIDYGSEPLPWIGMEYMDGGDLSERAGNLEFKQALWTAVAITKGVRHAHNVGVAHFDLKPGNILFRSVDNAWDVPKVADWGLSKQLLDHSKSVEGMSPHYAAPEQFDTEKFGQTDTLTDVYQLGAVFYELFTGHPPFEGDTFEIINKIQTEQPEPPSANTDIPDAIDNILLTALSTKKSERYEDVLYFRDDLMKIWDSHE